MQGAQLEYLVRGSLELWEEPQPDPEGCLEQPKKGTLGTVVFMTRWKEGPKGRGEGATHTIFTPPPGLHSQWAGVAINLP